ncbi:hypothetical protein L596_016251 [Steinernema carpocapsae]|uniref:Uncharacterized protein n=1 Tax=Steinernema carpocapsae TaxID=34508 RepID=A0A4U5NIE6_STECR|nr:hypothetical protein L596_016251 [Steinernema carpocapsae]
MELTNNQDKQNFRFGLFQLTFQCIKYVDTFWKVISRTVKLLSEKAVYKLICNPLTSYLPSQRNCSSTTPTTIFFLARFLF